MLSDKMLMVAAWLASALDIDMMEYATDGAAQTAYVTSDATPLQSYSENTIITQGAYALKLEATTDALNETVTKTLTGGDILDLTGMNTIKFDARSTGTGSNLQASIHDAGGTTSTFTIPIASADTYEAQEWTLPVADADKDNIDQIQFKVIDFLNNATFVDEDCSALGSWTDADNLTGVSSQATFDGEETFKFDTGSPAGSNHTAGRYHDFGSLDAFGNTIVIDFRVYHAAIGSLADTDYFRLRIDRSDLEIHLRWASDGFFILDGTSAPEIGTNLVQTGVWQTWGFVVDLSAGVANAVCDVYLKSGAETVYTKVGTAIDCSLTGSYTDGNVNIQNLGYTAANRITYVDYLKIGSSGAMDHYVDNLRAE